MIFSLQPIGNIVNRIIKYVIPAYQRSYRWTKDDVEKLLQDVWDSCERRDSEYFLGSIICCTIKKDGQEVHEVVDGQQRLITLTLVMRQLIEMVGDASLKEELSYRAFRVVGISGEEMKEPILTVQKKDQDAFSHIINGGKLSRGTKGIERIFVENTRAINAFFQGEEGLEGDVEKCNRFGWHLVQCVRVLQVISSGDRASSFRLFEVLNNRGMSLDPTDLIKNEFMEKAHARGGLEQEKKIEDQWEKLVGIISEDIGLGQKGDKSDDEGKTMRLFFSVLQVSDKKDRDRVRIEIYKYYAKRLSEVYGEDSVRMIGDILASAQNLRSVCIDDSSKKTMSFLLGFHRNTTEWLPAVMAFLNNKNYDMGQFPSFVELLEKLYMQKWLLGVSASKREAGSYYAIEAMNTGKSIDEVMGILRKLEENEAMVKVLKEEDFYDPGLPTKITFIKWILLRLSAQMGDPDVDTVHTGKISIEHILPVTNSGSWEKVFTKEQHAHWLHKIGNLAIIGSSYNSSAGNNDFGRKKEVYAKSDFAIARSICKYDEWGLEQIEERHAKIIEEIKNMWLVK